MTEDERRADENERIDYTEGATVMTLPELSAKATQGEWRTNKIAATHVENDASRGTAACGGYSDNCSDGRYQSENEANAAFIVALVNAYRSGQLVERDAVAGVVELLDDLETEADLCRNEGADDIAALLDRAIAALRAKGAQS